MTIYADYRIAAGHNVALASLTNIESVTPSTDRQFKPPKSLGLRSPGVYRVRGNGTIYIAGFSSTVWLFEPMTWLQYEYFNSTWLNSAYSGLVTIYTRSARNTYTRYNAVATLPKPDEVNGIFIAPRNVSIKMTRLEAL
jgi:hypothetical protein